LAEAGQSKIVGRAFREKARVTVDLNGVRVQNQTVIDGATASQPKSRDLGCTFFLFGITDQAVPKGDASGIRQERRSRQIASDKWPESPPSLDPTYASDQPARYSRRKNALASGAFVKPNALESQSNFTRTPKLGGVI